MASWSKLLTRIPREQFKYTFSRSSGPGGQNVNKVNSKATIRLSRDKIATANWLDEGIREKLTHPSFKYATKRGDLVISSELTRSQADNLNDCFEKLAIAIEKSSFVPAVPSAEAKQRWDLLNRRDAARKKDQKKRQSLKKQDRKL